MKGQFLSWAVLVCVATLCAHAEENKLQYLHFGSLADREVFNQAELSGNIEAAKQELAAAEERVYFEKKLWAKGYSSSTSVHQVESARDVVKFKIEAYQLELEYSKIQSQLFQTQMSAAKGEAVDLEATEKLYQSLLPTRCKIEAVRAKSDKTELAYAEAYVQYLKKHPSLGGLVPAESLVDQLRAKIAGKKAVLEHCANEFGIQ